MSLKQLFQRTSASLQAAWVALCHAWRTWDGTSVSAVASTHSADHDEMIAAIDHAVATGVNCVEYRGQTISFGNTRELLQERQRLQRLQAEQAGG